MIVVDLLGRLVLALGVSNSPASVPAAASAASDCHLIQTSRALAGLRDGWVLFTPSGSCGEPAAWTIVGKDNETVFDRVVRPSKTSEVVAAHFTDPLKETSEPRALEARDAKNKHGATLVLAVAPAPRLKPIRVRIDLSKEPDFGGGSYERAASDPVPSTDQKSVSRSSPVVTHVRALAVGRPNIVEFDTVQGAAWTFRFPPGPLQPCAGEDIRSGSWPAARGANGTLCVFPYEASADEPTLRAVLGWNQGLRVTASGIDAGEEKDLREQGIGPGSMDVSLPFRPQVIREAYPLAQLLKLACPHPGGEKPNPDGSKPPVTYVGSNGGIRAVEISPIDRGRACELRFEIPMSVENSDRLEAKRKERSLAEPKGRVESCAVERKGQCIPRVVPPKPCHEVDACKHADRDLDDLEEVIFREEIRPLGDQHFKVTAETSPDGKTFTEMSFTPAEIALSPAMDFARLRDVWVESSLDDDEERPRLDVVWELDVLQGGQERLPDYGEVKLTVAHASPASDFVSPTPGAAVDISPFQVHLRRMPSRFAVIGGAYEGLEDGKGPRFYASFQIPLGLLRRVNTGWDSKTSSEYDRMERVLFGAGLALTAEWWNFNLNEPAVPFNPQLNLGVFLNSPVSDLSNRSYPRLSYVLGGALRLPGGTSPSSVAETSLSLIVWYEWTKAPMGWQQGLLFGLGVKFGAWGN